ncbi:hypothetical protein BAY59_25865 [Prauserella coralliicola]|nr:hypothetical protein BAY59_25865 [Prauserella coralliicola]
MISSWTASRGVKDSDVGAIADIELQDQLAHLRIEGSPCMAPPDRQGLSSTESAAGRLDLRAPSRTAARIVLLSRERQH